MGAKMKKVKNQVRSKTRICHVEAFLRQELAAGPVDLWVLEQRAHQAGLLGEDQHITEAKAFRTAKKALEIMSVRTGFGRGGHWAWRLAVSPPDPKADGHLCGESNPPVTKSESLPAIIYGDANPSTGSGVKLSSVAAANTGLSPECGQIGGVPREWSESIRQLRFQARPREVPAHLWNPFVADCSTFLSSTDNWACRAANFGWDQFSLFGCSHRSPVLDLGCAGLLWVLRGGLILRLYRDWAEYVQAGTSRTYHRRRVDPARLTLPWLLR